MEVHRPGKLGHLYIGNIAGAGGADKGFEDLYAEDEPVPVLGGVQGAHCDRGVTDERHFRVLLIQVECDADFELDLAGPRVQVQAALGELDIHRPAAQLLCRSVEGAGVLVIFLVVYGEQGGLVDVVHRSGFAFECLVYGL